MLVRQRLVVMGLYLAPAHFIIIFIRRVRGNALQRGLRDKLRRILHYISEKRLGLVIVLWRSKDLFSIVAVGGAVPPIRCTGTIRTVGTRSGS